MENSVKSQINSNNNFFLGDKNNIPIDDEGTSINFENLYLNTESNVSELSSENQQKQLNNLYNHFSNVNNNNQGEIQNTINSTDNQNNLNTNSNINEDNESIRIINSEENIREEKKYCYVCESVPIEYYFFCGMGSCIECLEGHLSNILDNYSHKILSEEIKFICIGHCRCNLDSKEVIDNLILTNSTLKEKYHNVLFKMLISKSSDIISCPKFNCSNYGFVEDHNNYDCLECDICKTKIYNPNKLDFKNIVEALNNFSFSNAKTYLVKTITSKNCKKCNSPIEKSDGCKHIECYRCEYSFCWKCTTDWRTHSQKACMGLYSNEWDDFDPNILFEKLCITLILIIFLKFISGFYVIFKLYYVFMAILFSIGIYINNILMGSFIMVIGRNEKRKICYIPFILFFIVELIFYYFEFHPLSEKIYFYSQITTIIITGLFTYLFKVRKLNR
jgi:hypothetical protein